MVDNTSTPRPDSFSNTMEKHIETEGWEKRVIKILADIEPEIRMAMIHAKSSPTTPKAELYAPIMQQLRRDITNLLTSFTTNHKKEMEEAVKADRERILKDGYINYEII